MSDTAEAKYKIRIKLSEAEAGRHRDGPLRGASGLGTGARVGPAGRPAGPAERTGPRGCGPRVGAGKRRPSRYWVGFWVSGWAGFSIFPFYFLFTLSIQNLIQTKFEFKFEFEFKPHSNKIMHQHECNQKFKPRINFNH